MNPFDPRIVRIGAEIMHARPIRWDEMLHDGSGHKNGEEIIPLEYETTCPGCGQLFKFVPEEIWMSSVDGHECICCTCGYGYEENDLDEDLDEDLMDVLDEDLISALEDYEGLEELETVCPFIDPVGDGDFS